MKRTPILTAIAVATAFLVSCNSGSKTGIIVPKDAAVVVHINPSSLSKKLTWSEIKQTNWFQEMHKESKDSFAQQVLNNPEVSGVDVSSDLAFFMKKQNNGGFGVFEGKVKDAAAFEAFLKKTIKNSEAKKEGDWTYLNANSESLVAWDKNRFAYIVNMPFLGAMNGMGMPGQTTQFSNDSLKIFVKNVLSLDNDESLNDDDRFTAMMKQDGDVHFWMNSGQMYSGMGGGMMSMMKLNALVEGSISASTLSFEDGRIAVKTKQYYGKELTDLVKKFDGKPVTAEMVNRIPSQNVAGAIVANYPPEALNAFMKTMGFDGMANAFLGKYNYSLEELSKAYKGQMIFAATDISIREEKVAIEGTDVSYNSTKPDFSILFAMSVKDKASFEKLMSIGKTLMNEEGGQAALSQVSFKLNPDWFAVSNKPETVDKFLAGGDNKIAFADKLAGHPMGMYIDIQRIIRAFQPVTKSASSIAAMDASLKMWQDVVVTGGEFKDGGLVGEMVINMVDKKTNSLKQMNRYFEQLAAAKKQGDMAEQNAPAEDMPITTTDTLATTPQ